MAKNEKQHKEVKVKKPITKKWWFWVIIIIVISGAFGSKDKSRTSTSSTTINNPTTTSSSLVSVDNSVSSTIPTTTPADAPITAEPIAEPTATVAPTNAPATTAPTATPTNTPATNSKDNLKEALEVKESLVWFGDVRNDVTGNWKLSEYSESDSQETFAVDYYKAFFDNDKEIHAVINMTKKTTARLSMIDNNTIEVTILKYVNGEEHDAKALFGGDLVKQYWVVVDSGEIIEIG